MLNVLLFQALAVSRASLPPVGDGNGQADDHAFLQLQLDVATPQPAKAATDLLVKSLPLAWLHIPKCGTSFINALAHLPGVCPGIPDDRQITDGGAVILPKNEDGGSWTPGIEYEKNLGTAHGSGTLEDYCSGSFYIPRWSGHPTLMGSPARYEEGYRGYSGNGHTVGMFRQPEQLILSAYYYAWGFGKMSLYAKKQDVMGYAKLAVGMSTKMLTRSGGIAKPDSWLYGVVTEAEVVEAVGRVKHAFVFIGITDQWDLSMCLLHAMFGGPCKPVDFYNSRPGDNSSDTLYDTSVLNGFTDQYDGPVYDEASRVFNENLRAYGVSMASCQQCFDDATTYPVPQ